MPRPQRGPVDAMSQGRAAGRPGRNDPCPCGSGEKYKRCCGRAAREAPRRGAGGPQVSAAGLMDQAERLYRAGRPQESAERLGRVLAQDPRHAQALHLLGIVRHGLGDREQALRLLARAVSSAPREPVYRNSYGEVLRLGGDHAAALKQFDRALVLDPRHEGAANNKALALLGLGRSEEAAALIRHALRHHPRSALLHDNLGYVLQAAGALKEAAGHHRQALEIDPRRLSALVNLGSAYQSEGRYGEAMGCYERVLEHSGDAAVALHNLGICHQELGDIELALDYMERALALEPLNPDVLGDTIFARHHMAMSYTPELLEASRRWARLHGPSGDARPVGPSPRPRASRRPLTLGYLSPFALASTRYFNESVITRHSDDFHVVFYGTSPQATRGEPWSEIPRARWRDISHLSDAEAAGLIRRDKVDILVDLAGNVRGHRLGVLARRPASMILTWTESFYTTGCEAVDYFIGDDCSAPEAFAQWFTEDLARLPHMRFCYAPPAYAPPVGPPPRRSNGYTTFGCFTHAAKITPPVLDVWARILNAAGEARLVLKWKSYAEAAGRERILAGLARHGVGTERIEFRPHSDHRRMLAEYNDIDVALDTFPYNGGLTTAEALWMGVPVLSLLGDTVIGRQSACMLKLVGREDVVTDKPAAYVERAVALERDSECLDVDRNALRECMRRSPLCDAEAFTQDLESLYRELWERSARSGAEGGSPA